MIFVKIPLSRCLQTRFLPFSYNYRNTSALIMADEVSFEYLQGLEDDQNVLLIDVREPSELEKTGNIPGSINIPLATVEDTLQNWGPEEFQGKFKRVKPNFETPLVFSCHAGRRSLAALGTARKLGYLNVRHFPGGWSGWERQLKNENETKL